MSSVKLGWSSAEVKDARLAVALDGDMPEGWKESFERTAKLLGNGEWGEVELKKDTVVVSDIAPGSEDKLRHHLESIVAQANANQEAREREEHESRAGDDDDDNDDGGDQLSEADDEMAGRFRSFAEGSAESE